MEGFLRALSACIARRFHRLTAAPAGAADQPDLIFKKSTVFNLV